MTAVIHICRGVNRRYRGVVRLPGHRKWIHAGPWRKSFKRAADDMYRKFMKYPSYKRGEVWFISDYYDPTPVLEIKR